MKPGGASEFSPGMIGWWFVWQSDMGACDGFGFMLCDKRWRLLLPGRSAPAELGRQFTPTQLLPFMEQLKMSCAQLAHRDGSARQR